MTRGCGSHGIRFANPTGSTALLLDTRRRERRSRERAVQAHPHITPGGGTFRCELGGKFGCDLTVRYAPGPSLFRTAWGAFVTARSSKRPQTTTPTTGSPRRRDVHPLAASLPRSTLTAYPRSGCRGERPSTRGLLVGWEFHRDYRPPAQASGEAKKNRSASLPDTLPASPHRIHHA
jgi:hypothetical protein